MPALDRATVDHLTASLPAPRAERMRHAFEVFQKLDMPTGGEEDWRYVDLDVDLSDVEVAVEPGSAIPSGPFLSKLPDRVGEATIVDGFVTDTRSDDGVRVESMRRLGDDEAAGLFDLVPVDHDIFAAARASFGTDGVVVTIPRGAVPDRPVVIDVQATGPLASFPLISIHAEENAEAQVVVVYRSPTDARAVVSPQVGLHAGNGARLRYLAVQNFGFSTTAVIHQRGTAGRDASLRVGEVGLGGKLGRLDLGVLLEGAGASGEVVGLSFGEHDQILDYRMVITHRGRNTSSDVLLKGAVEDEARSVFTGLLKIEKDAVRSSAFETNRNLVLSEGAKAHSVPNLEILCDDVVCGHGSSVGPLEEEHLYYLMSRGLSRPRAERLLIRGFFQEVIDRLPVGGLAEPVSQEVFGRFVEAQREGRVA